MKTTFVKGHDTQIFTTYNQTFKDENRETILFVHGFPDDHRSWSYQLEHFQKKFNIAAIDLRGVGRSTAPADSSKYGIDDILPDFSAVRKFMAGEEAIHVVGHDWGAILLWCYLSEPSLQRSIKSFTAISCPHPSIALHNAGRQALRNPLALLNQVRKSWYIFLFQLPLLPEFALENFTPQIWNLAMNMGELPPGDEMRRLPRQDIIDMTKNSVNLYRQLLRRGIRPLPPQIDTPVSLIIAERDLAINVSVYDNHEEFCTHLGRHQLPCNHWAHREMPDQVNQIIENQVLSASGVAASHARG